MVAGSSSSLSSDDELYITKLAHGLHIDEEDFRDPLHGIHDMSRQDYLLSQIVLRIL